MNGREVTSRESLLRQVERQADELSVEVASMRSIRAARDDSQLELLKRSVERLRNVADELVGAIAEEKLLRKLSR